MRAGTGTEPGSLITFLIVSTVLAGMIGAPLMVSGLSRISVPADLVMAIIGALLIITGVVLRYAPQSAGTKTTVGIKDAVVLGVVQAFSIFPGLSRSGLTVSALLFRGVKVNYALKLSFLMSIPVVLAAEVGLVLMNKISFDLLALGGILTAFLFGILTIGTLMRIATGIAFWKFCLFLGGLSLLPLLITSL